MEFKEAIEKSLKTDAHTAKDAFLLHSRISDLVGNDYEAKKAAEEFYRLDAKYEISKAILAAAPKKMRRKRKLRAYQIKPMPIPPDDAYVFFSHGSRTLHLSSECPCLKNQAVWRSSYHFARWSDYANTTKREEQSYELSREHRPPICRLCGGFQPTFAKSWGDRIRVFLYDTFGIGDAIQFITKW